MCVCNNHTVRRDLCTLYKTWAFYAKPVHGNTERNAPVSAYLMPVK